MSTPQPITKPKDYSFIRDWTKRQRQILLRTVPEATREQVDTLLDEALRAELKNPKGTIVNNYQHMEIPTDLLTLIDWMRTTKPIIGGFGVFYRNQDQVLNPVAAMLENFSKMRNAYKSKLWTTPKGSYEYRDLDSSQKTEKINSNSYYGASGAPTSMFFNIFTATSVTATAQSLISTTEQAFEMFMTNSVQFYDLDEAFEYMENVRNEKTKLPNHLIPNVGIDMIFDHMVAMFQDFRPEYERPLFDYLMSLSQNRMNRLYFKNNLYAFSALPLVLHPLQEMMEDMDEFTNPNKVPEDAKKPMNYLWTLYEEFVFYNHFTFERIDRLRYDKRKTVVVVDTDSNMLNLHPWVEFVEREIVANSPNLQARNYDDFHFIAVNTICVMLTNVIRDVLARYCRDANIPKAYWHLIAMKNEYLFQRMIVANTKKRYVTTVKLREGTIVEPVEVDIKGFEFTKSSTHQEAKKKFTHILEERILFADEIDVPDILNDVDEFERSIRNSLLSGERDYLSPKSVKDFEAYKEPYSIQGVRAVIAWNNIYPDQEIQLPAKVDMVKIAINTKEDLEVIKDDFPEVYKRFHSHIFGHKHPKINKGIDVIAVPRHLDDIPGWIRHFMNVDTVVQDNLSKFYPILESLQVSIIQSSKGRYHSNILSI